jgi:release factor glutamine methyltransferase
MKFLNCEVDVSKKVFRPRTETGFWVARELKKIKAQEAEDKINVLDIFSGSGCIGIAVLKNIKNSKVDFVDIWPAAIEQLKINLQLNKIPKNKYKIYKSNLFGKLKKKKYDYIFANPPYVALDRIGEVQKEVLKNDPLVALFAGKDGMIIIEKFFRQVKNHLALKGMIFLEFDPQQKEKIKEILAREGFEAVFKKDQFGKTRWLETEISV